MAVSMRARPRRRPYGTMIVLGLVGLGILLILIPLARGEQLPQSLSFLSGLLPSEVFAGDGDEDEVAPPAPGKVRVLISARPIAAYAKVGRDDLFNGAKERFAHMDIDEELAESSGVLIDARDIFGRVMARPKAVGYAFTEDDFLPEGTRPGVAAGVPVGKRAVRIEVDKVKGIVGLQPGDRFDMVAAMPQLNLDQTTPPQPGLEGVYADLVRSTSKRSSKKPRTRVQVLIQNGVVVSPLETRLVPISSATLRGNSTSTIPVQEMVIALDPEEVISFMEAIANDAELSCLARSGHPDDPQDSVTPSQEPIQPRSSNVLFPGGRIGGANGAQEAQSMVVVETIIGGERKLVPVPARRSGNSSQAVSEGGDE